MNGDVKIIMIITIVCLCSKSLILAHYYNRGFVSLSLAPSSGAGWGNCQFELIFCHKYL